MAEKKYYWLKLMKDFFTQPKIKKLRRIAGGDTYTLIYLKLQLLSLENEGILCFQGIEDNFVEEMALTIDEDVENVNVTINYLMAQGLLNQVDDNEYLLTETIQLIGSETSVAKRVRKYRDNQKALHCNASVTTGNAIETTCNTEIDIEKELKKETYKDIVSRYTQNSDLISSLNDYIEMRKKMKGFTIRALQLALNKLDKLADDDETKIAIVNEAIEHSWKSFYELKGPVKKEEKSYEFDY